MNEIYVVTTIKFGLKELTVGPNKGKKVFAILDRRAVGWWETKEKAIQIVERNQGDIYEHGSYPYAVVEKVEQGLYPYCGESWWFKWSNKKYRKAQKPPQYRNVVNFAIG